MDAYLVQVSLTNTPIDTNTPMGLIAQWLNTLAKLNTSERSVVQIHLRFKFTDTLTCLYFLNSSVNQL